MRRLIYGVLILVVGVLGMTFTYRNAQPVELDYYFGIHWVAPLSFMLLTTFAIGVLSGFLASLAMVANMQRKLRLAHRETRQLEQEMSHLRALPIRDVP